MVKRLLIAALALTLFAAAYADKVGTPIPLGIALAQTSNVSLFGQEMVTGAKYAEQYINAHGGIGGIPLKLIFQDTGGDEAGAINAFNTLINSDKVVGIVGPVLSQQAFAADPIAVQAKIPVIGPSNTADGIPEIGPYVNRVSAPVSAYAPDALKALLKRDPSIKKVAQFYAQDDAFSKGEAAVFQDAFKKLGLDVVDIEKTSTHQSDFTSQVTTVLAKKPQLIEISTLAADGGNLVKQLRQFGYKGAIIGGNGLNTPNMFPVCGKYCDGIYVAEAYSPAAKNDINDWLVKTYKAKYNADPPQFTAQAFTAVQVFADALRRAQKQSGQKVSDMELAAARDALNTAVQHTDNLMTPLGPISIYHVTSPANAGGELDQKQFYVAQIKMNSDGSSGEFVYLQ